MTRTERHHDQWRTDVTRLRTSGRNDEAEAVLRDALDHVERSARTTKAPPDPWWYHQLADLERLRAPDDWYVFREAIDRYERLVWHLEGPAGRHRRAATRDHAQRDGARERALARTLAIDATEADFDAMETKLRERNQAFSARDVFWGVANAAVAEVKTPADLLTLSVARREMADVEAEYGGAWRPLAYQAAELQVLFLDTVYEPDDVLRIRPCRCVPCTRHAEEAGPVTLSAITNELTIPHLDCERPACSCFLEPDVDAA